MQSKPGLPESPGVDQSRPADNLEEILKQASAEIEHGNFAVAAELLVSASELEPRSHDLLNSAAVAFLRTGNLAGAEQAYRRVLQLAPNDRDTLHNLALTCWAQEKVDETRAILGRLIELDPQDAEVANDLAVFEDERGNLDAAFAAYRAVTALERATPKIYMNCFESYYRHGKSDDLESALVAYRARWGADAVAEQWQQKLAELVSKSEPTSSGVNVIEGGRVKGLKIAFFASFHSFLDPIMNDLKQENEIRFFEHGDDRAMRSLLEWCDLAWFEWCDNLVIAASKMPKRCKIICRLHSYEAFTEMPRQVDWSKIDHLVLVNRSVQELLKRSADPKVPITIIHNGVDTDKFSIPPNKKYGKRICSIGYINYKKNPALLLYCFKAIHDYDSSYRFHVAGTHQDPRIQIYFEHLLPKLNIPVSFDGWVDDVPGYLRDKDYVISTSLFESFHYSIAEGMASGLAPLIHDWFGASYLYPEEFLFTTPQTCVDLIKRLEKEDQSAIGKRCREYSVSRYEQNGQLAKINALIQAVTEGIL
jgi:glycosyltransferase involved in cell wall biosynthesis/Flp pilus assembly protein TadD